MSITNRSRRKPYTLNKQKLPAVSIIVPVYNAEKHLRECIDSVLAQTFADWELILVDDGSTDSSNKTCREYAAKDSRIRLIEKVNGGLSSARNAALDIAGGEYVFFLDADDELYPHTINLLYAIAAKETSDFVIGRMVYNYNKPDISVRNGYKTSCGDAKRIYKNILYQRNSVDNGAWAKLYYRSLFDGLRFYDGWFEDLEIFHKIVFRAKKLWLLMPLYIFTERCIS